MGQRYSRKIFFYFFLFFLDGGENIGSPISTAKLTRKYSIVVSDKGQHTLFVTVMSTLKWPLLSVVIPRLVLIGFNFCQPFMISRAIHLSVEPVTDDTTN